MSELKSLMNEEEIFYTFFLTHPVNIVVVVCIIECTHTHPLSACVLLTHNSSHSDMHVETCFQFFHFLVSTSSFSPLPPLTMSYINIVACMPKGYYTHPNLSIYRRQFKYTKNAKKNNQKTAIWTWDGFLKYSMIFDF